MKASASSRAIGGRSLWGNLIDVACTKYHWTFDYIMWGVSLPNLTMMLADSIAVYYTAAGEEREINADDPDNIALIQQIIPQ